uniref:Uncharacterized protein n=1 Tax=Arundo donax TaxID=35708 RepID=A0A0A9FS96_ARUDO
MLFHCPHASNIWHSLGLNTIQAMITCSAIAHGAHPTGTATINQDWPTIIIAVAWNIWLARNRKVFDNVDIPIQRIKEQCADTLRI